jgi:hypothetical protein
MAANSNLAGNSNLGGSSNLAGNSNFLRRSIREDGDKDKGARKKIKPKMFNFGW